MNNWVLFAVILFCVLLYVSAKREDMLLGIVDDYIVVEEDDTVKNDVYYVPEIIRKDTMQANDINSDLYFTGDSDDTPYRAWSTVDVMSLPQFYRSDFKTQMLGMKNFYDMNNEFHSKPLTKKMLSNQILRNQKHNQPLRYPNSHCYITKDNVNQCDFKNSYRKAPYSLLNVNVNGDSVYQPIRKRSIENVGDQDYVTRQYFQDEPMNGAGIFRNHGNGNVVHANQGFEEQPSSVLKEQFFE